MRSLSRCNRHMKTAVNILIAIAVLIVALSFILVYANTHPPRYPLRVPPSASGASFEDVAFTASDGVVLKGWIFLPKPRSGMLAAVILCHGLGSNRSDLTDLAVSLTGRGLAVLTFDFRAHGVSGGSRSSLGLHEQRDIRAALDLLRSRKEIDGRRIGIFGFSLGGAAAILTAADTGAFRAVVADSAFSSLRDQAREAVTGFYHLPSFPFLQVTTLGYRLSFGTSVDAISPERAIGRLSPVPVLIIAGKGDDLIPEENGHRLFLAAREPKELWIIPVPGHGGTIAAAGQEYDRRVGEFFESALGTRR